MHVQMCGPSYFSPPGVQGGETWRGSAVVCPAGLPQRRAAQQTPRAGRGPPRPPVVSGQARGWRRWTKGGRYVQPRGPAHRGPLHAPEPAPAAPPAPPGPANLVRRIPGLCFEQLPPIGYQLRLVKARRQPRRRRAHTRIGRAVDVGRGHQGIIQINEDGLDATRHCRVRKPGGLGDDESVGNEMRGTSAGWSHAGLNGSFNLHTCCKSDQREGWGIGG